MPNHAARNPTVCPLCPGPHSKAEHCCPNPTCPKKGNLRLVLNCCRASPACCPNCSEDNSAGYRDCTAHPIPTPYEPVAAPGPVVSFAPVPQLAPPPVLTPARASDQDAMDTQPNYTRHYQTTTPPLPGLESPVEFTTPRTPVHPALMGPSGSTSRIDRPQPYEEPSLSPVF